MSSTINTKWSRRDVLKTTGMAGAAAAVSAGSSELAAQTGKSAAKLPPSAQTAASSSHMLTRQGDLHNNLFTKIGVRPMINAHGTYTIISGSCSLPQVKQAMYDASFYFVHLDEMMNGIGAELGRLMGAEWGIATNGCCAAGALATLACIAGTDIEKCQALPYIKKKDQVLIPPGSRNQYDIGVRQTGVEIISASTPEELRKNLTDRVAMIYMAAGPRTTDANSPMSIRSVCAIAKEKGVPVFVDAAAEEPNKPNIHLAAGASLVGYSGGKCLRGPQSSGLLIGDKSLCKAAYYQAAPHHCYGRPLKCSKEEAMGILAAVREWYNRDHEAEQAEWASWMQQIADRVKDLPSVKTNITLPLPTTDPKVDLSNRCPGLRITWDPNKLNITGTEMMARLDAGTPRITLDSAIGRRPFPATIAPVVAGPPGRGQDMGGLSSIGVTSYMMEPGDAKIIADAIHEGLTKPGPYQDPPVPQGALASVAGRWAVTIHYLRGTGEQEFVLQQSGANVTGTQTGEIYNAAFRGTVRANEVDLMSTLPIPADQVRCNFHGIVQGNTMSGTLTMGEYGEATWSAVRA